jgi:arylamine N-acetyltransferase
MVNLVTIDGKTYLVDVAYGSNSPCRPVPLESGIEFDGVLPQRGRLDHKSLAKHTDSKQRVWVYSTQPSTDSAWKEEYCFVEVEFFPEDFGVMNLSTMTAPQSFFVQTVVATKILLNTQTAEPEGVLILHKDYVKRRIGEHTEVVQTLETEEQRVRALREHFLIDLRPGEQRAIHGMPSELKSGKAQPSGLH